MPSMSTSWIVKLGIANTFASSITRAAPVPMPNRAVRIGRPMASSEPKANRSTTTAPSRPMASLPPSAGSTNRSPASSSCMPSVAASSTR